MKKGGRKGRGERRRKNRLAIRVREGREREEKRGKKMINRRANCR